MPLFNIDYWDVYIIMLKIIATKTTTLHNCLVYAFAK